MLHHEGTKDTKVAALELSHEVLGAAIEVHRHLGPGLLESVYENPLCKELWLRRVSVERQVDVPVYYKGVPLECSVKIDLLVNRTIIVEVKSVEKIINIHRAQLLALLRGLRAFVVKNWTQGLRYLRDLAHLRPFPAGLC